MTNAHRQPIDTPPPGDAFEAVACTICRGRDLIACRAGDHHLNLVPPLRVVTCARCRLRFMSPRPGPALRGALLRGEVPEALAAYGQAANYGKVNRDRKAFFAERLEHLRGLLDARGVSGRRLLDVGASAGTFVHAARERGWTSFGVEPSSVRRLPEAAAHVPSGLAEGVPYATASFDVVHSHHVVEHLTDPAVAIAEMHRVLRPGGLLFIEVPNQLDNVWFLRNQALGRVEQRARNMRSIHHLWFFGPRPMRKLLAAQGFADIALETTLPKPELSWQLPWRLLENAVARYAKAGSNLRAVAWKR
jgi:SAM-dependent methyltransferase